MEIHADLLYSRTGYDVISYFRSVYIEVRKKWLKLTALIRILRFACHTSWWLPVIDVVDNSGEEIFYPGTDTLGVTEHKDSESGINRMVEDLNKQLVLLSCSNFYSTSYL